MTSTQAHKSGATSISPQRPRVAVEAVAGFTAGLLNTLVVHPLDLIKTRLQVNRNTTPTKLGASLALIGDIARNEAVPGAGSEVGNKLRALYRGLTPNVLGNTAGWALYFMWYGEFKSLLAAYRGGPTELGSTDYLLASGTAGTLSALFTNPIWVVKTRMLSTGRAHPNAYKSLSHGLVSLLQIEGPRGLFRGMVPALFGVTHGAVHFTFYEKMKLWRLQQLRQGTPQGGRKPSEKETDELLLEGLEKSQLETLTNWDYISLSALSKITAGALTYPYQVIRARLQIYDAEQEYKSARDVIAKIWRAEGGRGFYKGLGPNLARVLPSTCITFLVYENTRYYLR
ncbi:mitochondrial folate carrier protein [Terfezia boudieri ATCC MYA-4762]|uniref:Mitochondrial folate carrier protein n=1 Tax=Terfezia boudieri ATCC MYA-4762 TaxID=1051890 RepID=A0A3N4M4U5_9PEZI|nr:mitochondrial folate carrier protein [Terfezia boudieri ATCC MYA-4762]